MLRSRAGRSYRPGHQVDGTVAVGVVRHQWPHRLHSRFVQAAGLGWHVQQFAAARPNAPDALLIHGTGASTHSWRALIGLLTPHFNVLSFDLPGHAFTDLPPGGASAPQMSLPGMANAIGQLLHSQA